jgi:hypothetical protein
MDVSGSTSSEVTIRLTGGEALVLSDAFADAERRGSLSALHRDDPATRQLIEDLIASFEPVIDQGFAVDYSERVERARRAIIDGS